MLFGVFNLFFSAFNLRSKNSLLSIDQFLVFLLLSLLRVKILLLLQKTLPLLLPVSTIKPSVINNIPAFLRSGTFKHHALVLHVLDILVELPLLHMVLSIFWLQLRSQISLLLLEILDLIFLQLNIGIWCFWFFPIQIFNRLSPLLNICFIS